MSYFIHRSGYAAKFMDISLLCILMISNYKYRKFQVVNTFCLEVHGSTQYKLHVA